VSVRLRILPAATDVDAALAPGAPRVFADWPDNVAAPSRRVGSVEVGFAEAQVIAGPSSPSRGSRRRLEPRGVLAWPSAHDGRLTVWSSTQVPYAVRAAIAGASGRRSACILAPDVGGRVRRQGHAYRKC
jgi:carbon-monoxide dehydrogenase large subunit